MIEIRPATSEDARACGTIMQDWLDNTPWIPNLHTVEDTISFSRNRLIEKYDTYVAGEPTIGFISIEPDGDIAALYLDQNARSQGIGRQLLDLAKTKYAQLELWVFQQNDRAVKFYEENGFVETRRTNGEKNDEKLPDIRMRWQS